MPSKTCFVTIGATASFSSLVQAVLAPNCLAALQKHGYTNLIVQYGEKGESMFDRAVYAVEKDGLVRTPTTTGSTIHEGGHPCIEVSGFDLDRAGLSAWLRQAKGKPSSNDTNDTLEGVVISHAGSGTVLDALRIAVPIIVVPNPELLDNHQVELAEALAEQEYVVHGSLSDLPRALEESESLRSRSKAWPPVNSGAHRKAAGLKSLLDEEMGFLD